MRLDLNIIASLVKENSKVLDVGCGDGTLLQFLQNEKHISARGIEINTNLVSAALKKGLAVIQGDADNDLKSYPANSCDYVILSQTLQATKYPDLVLQELQRIAQYIIVSVPNFGYFENRLYLSCKGKMPVTKTLSYEWYNTPNIHFCTIKDFKALATSLGFTIEQQIFVNEALPFSKSFSADLFANIFAKYGIFLLKRGITADTPKSKMAFNLNSKTVIAR